MMDALFRRFESRVDATALPPNGAPPTGLLAFYWHFIRQTRTLFMAMLLSCLLVALSDTVLPVLIGKLVAQDTSLLHRSIADNIRYGKPEVSMGEVIAATHKAQATDFFLGLRDWKGRGGFDAQAGERGVNLSGGQRQRIAIARVVLKDSPILILDEATSALDSEVELAIQQQLLGLMHGKTVIAIAHRLSTIARMDRLVVLEQGRIVEAGTHAQLLALRGHYFDLWQHQSGGFLPAQLPSRGSSLAANTTQLAV